LGWQVRVRAEPNPDQQQRRRYRPGRDRVCAILARRLQSSHAPGSLNPLLLSMEYGGRVCTKRLEDPPEPDLESRISVFTSGGAHREVRSPGGIPARVSQRVSAAGASDAARRTCDHHGACAAVWVFGSWGPVAVPLPGREAQLRAAIRIRLDAEAIWSES